MNVLHRLARDGDASRDGPPEAEALLELLPDPLFVVDGDDRLIWLNGAAEQTFAVGRRHMIGVSLESQLGPDSALAELVMAAREAGAVVRGRHMRIAGRPPMVDAVYDVEATPDVERPGNVLIALRERALGDRLESQMQSRGTARSLAGLAATLAHEVKNPLSGIRGAAQLLEAAAADDDKELARLIADEVDRICALLDRMEAFSDRHPMPRRTLNIHEVVDHVIRLARAGVARGITIVENFDPSLPPVLGNRDALVQVLLNLVKNAAEATGQGGIIRIATAYDGGLRLAPRSGGPRQALPLVISVADDGPGIPANLVDHVFEPFVSGKETSSGLGLALVAKIVDDHGGVIMVDSQPGHTEFRIALPLAPAGDSR